MVSVFGSQYDDEQGTLGARDFSSAVSGFCQVFIVTRVIDGSEKRNRHSPFELRNSHVCEKRSKSIFKINPREKAFSRVG